MTKLSQLKIDPEFQNQINPPSFEETHQLEMNILKEERVLNPIITWNGYIVDGHTRYQILRKYPFIPFEVIEKEFSSRYEALVWICKNQLGRRNLTILSGMALVRVRYVAIRKSKTCSGSSGSRAGTLNKYVILNCWDRLPQKTSHVNVNLSGRGPSILLRKTVLSLKSPTGAFIAPLRCANANF